MKACQQLDKPVTLTNVLVPTLNDSERKLGEIKRLKETFSCIKEVKFLAFRKLCESKYQRLNMPFPYDKYREGDRDDLKKAYDYIL